MPKTSSGESLSRTRSGVTAGSREQAAPKKDRRLDLFRFVPFRLNRLAAEVSAALASEYQERYGLDIPEWRVLATLGFRNDACSAQYIADCTRTHKSTISRAVTALMERQLVERVENEDDRREFRLRMTRKGDALYEQLIPAAAAQGAGDPVMSFRARAKGSRGHARQDRAKPRSRADQQRGGCERGVLRAIIPSVIPGHASRGPQMRNAHPGISKFRVRADARPGMTAVS